MRNRIVFVYELKWNLQAFLLNILNFKLIEKSNIVIKYFGSISVVWCMNACQAPRYQNSKGVAILTHSIDRMSELYSVPNLVWVSLSIACFTVDLKHTLLLICKCNNTLSVAQVIKCRTGDLWKMNSEQNGKQTYFQLLFQHLPYGYIPVQIMQFLHSR